MKKISIILSTVFVFFSTGCEKYVSKDDVDPNYPTEAPIGTLLTTSQVTIFSLYNGQMSRNAGMWVQHFEGTLFQMVEQGSYSLSENDVQNDWNTTYTAGVVNANLVISKGLADGEPYYVGIGEACKALLLGIATDYWGDIPSREAGLSGANLYPHYDAQQTVLADIQTMLSDAITQLSKSVGENKLLPGTDDLIHQGDAAAWIKTCWIIKARYHNRLSQRDPAGSATDALADIDAAIAAGLSGNDDDANAIYGTEGGTALNPWFAFQSDRTDYIKLSATLVDTMKALNDPRLQFYGDTIVGGEVVGAALGSEDVTASNISSSTFAAADAPLPLVTYVEAKFIEAEAALRAGNTGRAQTAYTEAITASITRFGADPTAYLAANGTLTGGNELNQIMFQKWIAMFTQPEAWSDWRRTNIPNLTPNPNGVQSTIPVRYPTEQNERLLNPNAVVVSDLVTPVWWDL
jgi:hypothetical protein